MAAPNSRTSPGRKPRRASAAANRERGEHELVLEGATYRLRPSFAANVAIEAETGKTLLQLCGDGDRGAISLEHLGVIAAEWIKAGAEDEATRHVGARRIAELIYEAGIPFVNARITTCLVDAVTGGRTASGEAKATTD